MTHAPQQPLISGEENARYFDEWRRSVTRDLAESARLHSQAAVTFERVNSRLDEHDRRIAALERAPAAEAQQQQTRAGLNLQAVYLGVAICALIVAILSPHLGLTFH